MRRITMAFLATVTLIVLLFSYPTSTNRVASAASVATTTGVSTSSSSSAAPSGSSTSSGTSSGSSGGSGGPTGTTSSSTTSAAMSYTGTAVDTQYGPVQVRITVSGSKITAATAVEYPSGNGRDQEINATAIPQLNSEVVQKQTASIDMVSGATYTSTGYLQSLQSAIDQAHL
ncbi:FMN-binding protein [Allobranchiibius sp. CTAmp26]|uniref:FMN-binding protein n=1 Tax=Allobranchiibius sp. CTAmp26 TaxID=2815214 RepID=UPI001AA16B1B|nr:FMN-binding protein [Allobranchiibius sp. CTAmp26]MBO1754869.1 FMN-binding protein [Allobranchiibius sp. CTAmp26]